MAEMESGTAVTESVTAATAVTAVTAATVVTAASLAWTKSLATRLWRWGQTCLVEEELQDPPRLEAQEMRRLCDIIQPLLASQPVLLELQAPVKVVGDLHGQYLDLLRHFNHCGQPSKDSSFVFLGGFVNFGRQSTETLAFLYAMKIIYPENVFLLRSIHETRALSKSHGFYCELEGRFKSRDVEAVFKCMMESMDWLPVAALVAGRVLCSHGGLSPALRSLEDLRSLERPAKGLETGLLSDLLWSEPGPGLASGWLGNAYAEDVVVGACEALGLDLVVTGAHRALEQGFKFFADRRLVQLHSAPYFQAKKGNMGAVLCMSADLDCSFKCLLPLIGDAPQT